MSVVLHFFSTFQPKDWVTAALALAALVVATLAITQKSRHLPKALVQARMQFRSGYPAKGPVNWIVRTVENKGNGTAYDVHEYLFHAGKPNVRLELTRNVEIEPSAEGLESRTLAAEDARIMRVLVTWRQAPNMKRIHRKVLSAKGIPNEWQPPPKIPEPTGWAPVADSDAAPS